MIAFGCAITEPEVYRRHAERGIRLAGEPDSAVFPNAAPRSVVRTYNLTLEHAAAQDDLEALVLVDQRAEIIDPDLCGKLREAMLDPEVAVVGCAGARGVRSIAWWEGTATWASSIYRSGDTDFPALLSDGWKGDQRFAEPGEAETVDGVLMALSPWAVRNIRFDESLGPRYGYDFDFCLQVRAANRKVVTADLKVAHSHPLGVLEDPDTWMEAHMRAAEKWDGRMPQSAAETEVDWKPRARRAEAEAATARLLSASKMYEIQALEWEHERQLEAATSSLSWRITEPLRKVNALLKAARERRAA